MKVVQLGERAFMISGKAGLRVYVNYERGAAIAEYKLACRFVSKGGDFRICRTTKGTLSGLN